VSTYSTTQAQNGMEFFNIEPESFTRKNGSRSGLLKEGQPGASPRMPFCHFERSVAKREILRFRDGGFFDIQALLQTVTLVREIVNSPSYVHKERYYQTRTFSLDNMPTKSV
jgi:hypothetical protein